VGKRLERLKAAIPMIAQVAVLVHAANRTHGRVPGPIAVEARALEVGEAGAFDHAFGTMAASGAEVNGHRHQILDLACTHRLPNVCGGRQNIEAGCVIAYSASHIELFRRAAVFEDKILKGAKAAALPVE
jgi:putative tryptophan/tyrosine transport system substrate-binding protein